MEKQIILIPALAEMTLARVNPVVGLKERPKVSLKRLPIISSGQVFNYDMPIEFIMECHNQIVFGNIPPINDMSAESIIGVVEMGCEANENEFRLWREMMQGELFLITDCFIFEFPVNQNLVNMYKLNADDLLRIFPFHKLTLLNGLRDLDDTLKVEMGKQAFLHVTILHDLTLDLTPHVKEIVLDEDGNIKGFKFLLLTCDNMEKRFDFKAKLIFEMNGEKEPMLFNSAFDPSGKNIREQIVFDCSSQLLR